MFACAEACTNLDERCSAYELASLAAFELLYASVRDTQAGS